MSVNTWYRCIFPERLEQLIEEAEEDPEAVEIYLHPDDEDEDADPKEPHLWTERNWVGVLNLLSVGKWAEEPLLRESITGGTPIGGDLCYHDSPGRYLRVAEVKAIAAALQTVEEAEFSACFTPEFVEAMRLNPDDGWSPEYIPYLWKTFSNIRDFFNLAHQHGYAVLVYVC
jgi:hypothetical protein